jgi:hypothetical protein
MWLMAVSLTLGGLAILVFALRKWRTGNHRDVGSMSQQWVAAHRAGSHGD